MTDLATFDYGTINDYLIPEPDCPLTTDWGVSIAKGIAKLTKVWDYSATLTSGSYQAFPLTSTRANFTILPLTQMYVYENGMWTDFYFLGTGNNIHSYNELVNENVSYLLNAGTGTATLRMGAHSAVGFHILQYGG